jgi:hypothetical protein
MFVVPTTMPRRTHPRDRPRVLDLLHVRIDLDHQFRVSGRGATGDGLTRRLAGSTSVSLKEWK